MREYELFASWGIIYSYALCTVMLLTAFIFNKDKLLNITAYILLPTFAVHSLIFVSRWHSTGYFPANGAFENGITSGWFAVGLTVYLFVKKKALRGVGLVTVPATLLALGYGIMVASFDRPHEAALKSSWLVIHVAFAQLAFGAYLVASGLGVLYLLKDNSLKKSTESAFYAKLPALPVIDETMFRFVVYGFIADAIMIAAGSIWAKELWGSYWSWDPVEVWSLLAWLVYGLTIHLRVTLGWRGRRLAWIFVFAIFGIVIAYWGVDFMVQNTLHVFGVKS
ncbi:MAG: cytochrome C biogenesis protein [Nitrospirae bacterium]|nr:MAG: cytochrome C biogenesis protein [Nitrospirota bacterium]